MNAPFGSDKVEEEKKIFYVEGKRFIVYGQGRSGLAADRLLLERGGIVTAIDDAGDFPDDRRAIIDKLLAGGMTLLTGLDIESKRELLKEADALVVSPGVMLPIELKETCADAGVEILGEFELAARLCPAPVIAVSGSNGKTTTSCLIYEFVKRGGLTAHLVGNVGSSYNPAVASGYQVGDERILFTGGVGVPFAERVDAIKPDDIVVAEVSSYQLETVSWFHPKVSVLLNIAEDHLARHGDMGGYAAVKARVFNNQTADDFAVLNADDPLVLEAYDMDSGAAGRMTFSFRDGSSDAFYRDNALFIRVNAEHVLLLKREEFNLPGEHNVENLMAAALAAVAVGVDTGHIRDVARIFRGVEHRIEFVGEFMGIKVYNDSKGTNPDSTIKALSAFGRPVILIIGGYEKGSDFTPLYEVFPEKVSHALIVGATAERLDRELLMRGLENRTVTGDLDGALQWVRRNGKPGDVLLLSPASASFDQFESYEERGKVFKKLVNEILG